jgi:cytochrome c oxidase subunit 2
LPVNKQALLNMTSTDVIHSFWIPEFRVKQDLLPGDGFEKELRITPIELGEYKVRCAELCGREHYNMLAPVQVLSQDDFEAWVAGKTEAVSDDPVMRGEQVAQQYGCTACHSSDGSELAGPTWMGLFGSTVALSDGSTVLVDSAYVIESIREPGKDIVQGYQNIMPANIGADLTDEQLNDLVAYIESLQ